MTLIAATTNQNTPILLGDILISSPVQTKSVKIPTHSQDIDPYLEENAQFKPTGFFQKIYVIKPNVAVALAGRVNEMIWFLKEFRQRCSYFPELSQEKVSAFIEDIDIRNNFAGSAFLIVWTEEHRDGSIHPHQAWGPAKYWTEFESPLFGEVSACGSGASSFLRTVKSNNNLERSSDRGSHITAITQNMILVGTILAAERTTLYNINELWGAGFEMIRFGETGFAKFADHTFILVESRFDKEGNLEKFIPKIVQHYTYRDDILLISAIDILSPVSDTNDLDEVFNCENNFESFYFVPSLDSPAESHRENFPDDLSFSSGRVVFGFSVILNDQSIIYPGVYYESSDDLVRYDHRKKIKISMPLNMIEKVRDGVLQAFRNIAY